MVSRLQPVFRASWARKMPTCCSMKIPLESVVATEPTLRITQLEQGIQAMVSTPEEGQTALPENSEPKTANWVAAGNFIGAGIAIAKSDERCLGKGSTSAGRQWRYT